MKSKSIKSPTQMSQNRMDNQQSKYCHSLYLEYTDWMEQLSNYHKIKDQVQEQKYDNFSQNYKQRILELLMDKEKMIENLGSKVQNMKNTYRNPESDPLLQKLDMLDQKVDNQIRNRNGPQGGNNQFSRQSNQKLDHMFDMMMYNMSSMQQMMMNVAEMQKNQAKLATYQTRMIQSLPFFDKGAKLAGIGPRKPVNDFQMMRDGIDPKNKREIEEYLMNKKKKKYSKSRSNRQRSDTRTYTQDKSSYSSSYTESEITRKTPSIQQQSHKSSNKKYSKNSQKKSSHHSRSNLKSQSIPSIIAKSKKSSKRSIRGESKPEFIEIKSKKIENTNSQSNLSGWMDGGDRSDVYKKSEPNLAHITNTLSSQDNLPLSNKLNEPSNFDSVNQAPDLNNPFNIKPQNNEPPSILNNDAPEEPSQLDPNQPGIGNTYKPSNSLIDNILKKRMERLKQQIDVEKAQKQLSPIPEISQKPINLQNNMQPMTIQPLEIDFDEEF